MVKENDPSKAASGAFSLIRGMIPGHGISSRARRRMNPKMEQDLDVLTKRVILPSLPVSDEEMARATHQDKGQKLVRQDRWEDLSRRIRYADETRLATHGGEPASLLLAFGARSDIIAAAEDAMHDGQEPNMEGIEAFEEELEEEPGDYARALVVALTHLDIAWAWHNIMGAAAPETSIVRTSHHIKRADAILSRFDATALNAPSIAAARCAINATCEERSRNLANDYEKLIDLDPDSHRHMRALGRHMLQRVGASPNALEIEARKTALRTQNTWSAGGYTWVYFDALALNQPVVEMLDAEFFIEGLRDIVSIKPDQHIVNLLASFCAITMAPGQGETELTANAEAARARVHECLDWLLSDHLQELHPLIWSQSLLAPGQAPLLPSRRALLVKGRQTALRIIASRFAADIADGSSIAFSAQGMYRLPAI